MDKDDCDCAVCQGRAVKVPAPQFWFDEVADIDLDKMARELLPVVDRQTELELRRLEGQRQHEQEKREAYLFEKYGPKTAVPRICGWKREDTAEPATVHENTHNLGTDSGNAPDHRMGWKP